MKGMVLRPPFFLLNFWVVFFSSVVEEASILCVPAMNFSNFADNIYRNIHSKDKNKEMDF